MKVLIVEDEQELLETISSYLLKEGFVCEAVHNYAAAQEKLALYEYTAVILDITLPDGNGLDVLKTLKQDQVSTGVIIISARNSLEDKLIGLDLGADDYLTKPFHLAELNSRIHAIIRRSNFEGQTSTTVNGIEVDPAARTVVVCGTPIELTRKEFDLLLYFIVNKNRVLTREAIAEHLWGDHGDMADSFDFIYTHVKNLRNKIRDAGGTNCVKTIYGTGYKFVAP